MDTRYYKLQLQKSQTSQQRSNVNKIKKTCDLVRG